MKLSPVWLLLGCMLCHAEECLDYGFLHAREGLRTKGYIPKLADGSIARTSGVTIGAGVNLGSKNRQYFEDLNVPIDVIDKLEPYLGLTTNAAEAKLNKTPLMLTDEEANSLSEKVTQKLVTELEQSYNNAIGSDKLQWNQLTNAQRTVISSVVFQYGDYNRVPSFWSYSTDQDWGRVEVELRNFHDQYPRRRVLEADYLANDDGSNTCGGNGGSGHGQGHASMNTSG